MQNGVDTSDLSIVQEDRFCLACGYNVRTLKWSGQCPECGRSVWDSRRKTLQAADRNWLRTIQWGLWLLAASVFLVGLAFVAARGMSGDRWVVFSYLLMPLGSKLPLERVGYF